MYVCVIGGMCVHIHSNLGVYVCLYLCVYVSCMDDYFQRKNSNFYYCIPTSFIRNSSRIHMLISMS